MGDGDNFRLYHTPGGKLTGWGWLPWKKVPTLKKELRDKTVRFFLATHIERLLGWKVTDWCRYTSV